MSANQTPDSLFPSLTGILETSLYVADLGKAIRFYADVFGLRIMVQDDRFCALSVVDRQVLLLFKQGGSVQATTISGGVIPPHDGSGQAHLAFSVAAEELKGWETQLARHAVAIESRVHWPAGGTSLYVRDPDGNLLELVTPGCWPIY